MDKRTLKVLEFNTILGRLSEEAVCAETAEKCRALVPSTDIYEATRLLKQTSEAESLIIKKGAPPFSAVRNVLGGVKRSSMGGVLTAGELLCVSHILRIARMLTSYSSEDAFLTSYSHLAPFFDALCENRSLERAISSTILSEEEIADDASPTLLSIRRKKSSLHTKVREVLNDMIHSARYAPLLQEPIVTMRGDRYVIPVKSEHKGEISGVVHDSSSSGATLFIEPMAAVEINNKLRALLNEEKEEIDRILAELSARVGEDSDNICRNYTNILEIDFIFARGKLARKMNASMPSLNSDGIINIKKGRHPLIDEKTVVPTDIYLGKDFDTLVITGPNTGGKTVSLKTLGLFTLMAQSGLCIPASGGSEMSIFENIFADIGDEQSIEQSLSTFSAHMTNIIKILERADYKSLVLFDELGAGTDPVEGAALAISILERVKMLGAKTAATTHYSEIKLYALGTDRVENAACEFDVKSLRPTYRLLIGVPGKSNAFAISKRLGLEDDIIERAKALIDGENTRFEDVIATLEKRRMKAEEELSQARKAREKTVEEQKQAEKQSLQTEKQKEKILADARRDAKKIYEQAKAEADRIVREMQALLKESASGNSNKIAEGRRQLKKGLDDATNELAEDVFTSKKAEKLDPSKIKLGQVVEVTTMNQTGNVLTLPDKRGDLTVQVGILKIKTNISSIAPHKEEKKKQKVQTYFSSERAVSTVKSEIDLRGETADDAILLTDKYLDDAVLAHLETVSIIHGKGTGVLRQVISDMLRHHPHVKSYRSGRYGEGESGVTIVELK